MVVLRLSLSRYGSLDLASPDQSWIVSHGCREEDCPRNICPGYYVLGNGDSFSRLPTTSTKLFGYFFSCNISGGPLADVA